MTAAALVLFAISAGLAAWSYLVYPVMIRSLAARAAAKPAPDGEPAVSAPPSVEVLVSAADEEAVIGARVEDLLRQQTAGAYGVVIGCDGSRDATAARARQAGGERVRVVEFPQRRGKASVLNDLVAGSVADVVIFTDANTRFEAGAVSRLLAAMDDPAVGAVCGRLVFETGAGARETPESVFWDRETAIKEAEGRLDICLGANGGIYAARRRDVPRLPPDTTSMDDFLIPIGIARRGLSVVFAADAVARESAARDVRSETDRRFRIGVGAGQVLRRELWLWDVRRRPLLAFAFVSRKAARWLAPLALLLSAIAALGSASLRPAGAAVLIVAASCAFAVRAGVGARGRAGRLYYFVVINLALAAGLAAGLAGYRRPAWKPVARS